jgi:hypothetical protein
MSNLCNYININERKIYKSIFIISVSIYFIYIFTAIASSRFLYADGADFYVSIINNLNNFWPYFDDSQHIRLFVNLINQLPISLALICGIRRMDILRILFGAPLFINNLIGMVLCTWICYRAKKLWLAIFPISSYVLFGIISEIFIVNQAFLALWLYYIAFLYLVLEMKWKIYDWILLLGVLVTSYRSHEGILVYGPLIIVYFIISLKKIINENRFKILIVVSTIFEIVYAAWWQVVHPVKEATDNYLNLLKILLNPKILITSNILFSIIGGILLLVVLIFGYKFKNLKSQAAYYKSLLLFGIISIIFGFFHIRGIAANPFNEYNYRVFATFGGAFFMILCIAIDKLKLESRVNIKLCFITIVLLLLIQSIWQIGNNYQWNILKNTVKQQVINNDKAIINPNEINLTNNALPSNKYQWSWTGPVFSIALHDSLSINSIIASYECNEKPYFDVNPKDREFNVPFVRICNNIYNLDGFFQKYIDQNSYKIGSKVEVGKNSNMINCLSHGWASPEEWGVWSNSNEAGIQLNISGLNKEEDITFKGNFSGYIAQGSQIVQVYANENLVGTWEFNSSNSEGDKEVIIPKNILKNMETLNINFKISNPVSPASLGLSDDKRDLGIAMRWFALEQ